MSERILVTGGAGFIGSHLVDHLLALGKQVRVLDNLLPQAHPSGKADFLDPNAELIVGDVRSRSDLERALQDVQVVVHLAGMVGNGQSMIEVHNYIDVNAAGTALLMEELIKRRSSLRRLVVASSMVVYGDGAYACKTHGPLETTLRPLARLKNKLWNPICPHCQAETQPVAIQETRRLAPNSVYGISKRDQEELCLVLGKSYQLPTIALRYLCTYGSRQALGNPYTGVAAIWATRLLNHKPALIFEDGNQLRDFVHVTDVARATAAAAHAPTDADYQAFNIGSGTRSTISELAVLLAQSLGSELAPSLSGDFRVGDIRHCFADISKAKKLLQWSPRLNLAKGIEEFAHWARDKKPIDVSDTANRELRLRGIIQ